MIDSLTSFCYAIKLLSIAPSIKILLSRIFKIKFLKSNQNINQQGDDKNEV